MFDSSRVSERDSAKVKQTNNKKQKHLAVTIWRQYGKCKYGAFLNNLSAWLNNLWCSGPLQGSVTHILHLILYELPMQEI